MQRLLPLFKVCRLSTCTMLTQPFMSRWCSPRQTNSREQRITLLPLRTANFFRKRKRYWKRQRRSSSRRPRFRRRLSSHRAEHPCRRVYCPQRICEHSAGIAFILLSQLHLSNERCLAHSFEHVLLDVHPESPTPVCPPGIAAAKGACRGIIVLGRQSSFHSGAA